MTKQVIIKETKVVSKETQGVLLDNTRADELIQQFNEAKSVIKQMEQQKAEAEAALRELMGEAQVGLINGVERIKIATRTRQDINKDDLKNAYPEAFELCLQSKTYTVLTATS